MLGPIANKDYVLKYLNIYDTHALKKYGQNFLIDDELAESIVSKVKDDKDSIILEIGSGLGALTYHLVKKEGHKVLVEIDPLMCDHLKHQIQEDDIEILNMDFLRMNLKKYDKEIVVVGNLPYYITTDIIEKLLLANNVTQMTLMVQKEAYERLTAPISSKEYSPISIFLEYVGGTKILSKVSRHSYIPEPHVDSLVFQVNVKKEKQIENESAFFKITKAMFLMRRKTILNNLTSYLKDKQKAETILNELSCPLTARPEQLNLDFYLKLTKEILKCR